MEKPRTTQRKVGETPYETLAGYCVVAVIWFFATTLMGQNMVIPSGSMEKTLLVGDHLLVDRSHLRSTHAMDAAGSLPRAPAWRHSRLH